jgi:hypothetical protein
MRHASQLPIDFAQSQKYYHWVLQCHFKFKMQSFGSGVHLFQSQPEMVSASSNLGFHFPLVLASASTNGYFLRCYSTFASISFSHSSACLYYAVHLFRSRLERHRGCACVWSRPIELFEMRVAYVSLLFLSISYSRCDSTRVSGVSALWALFEQRSQYGLRLIWVSPRTLRPLLPRIILELPHTTRLC